MCRTGGLSILLVAFVACARGNVGSSAPSEGSLPLSGSAARPSDSGVDGQTAAPAPLPPSEWAEAVRQHKWDDAARLMDALSEAEKSKPEIKYARARVAIAMGDHGGAQKRLDGLESSLPSLSDEIKSWRAEAELEAGPFESAAKFFLSVKTVAAQTKVAIAYERAEKLKEARTAADRAVTLAITSTNKTATGRKKNGALRDEAGARRARARIAQKQGAKAIAAADLRWLATFAPTEEFSKEVDDELEKLAPEKALTSRERLERALAMARAGRIEQVEREVTLLEKAAGPKVSKAELLHARGLSYYQARDYPKAAELLEQASALGGPTAAEDLFTAARARSRAQDDDRALAMLGEVMKKFKTSGYAEQARFLKARLLYMMGRWREAATAYSAYANRKTGEGRSTERAQYEQAVAWLAAGDYTKAAKALNKLGETETDDHDRAQLRELEGVALAGAGKKKEASSAFRKVIADRPLSFAALASVTRLRQLGESSPALIEPAKSGTPKPMLKVELPPKAKLLRSLGLDADAERVLADDEERIRKQYAPRGDEALCRMYGELSEAARRYRVGQRAARWDELGHAPSPESRWIWECVYPRPHEDLVRAAEKEWSLPAHLVYAVMRQESAFATSVVSPANAVGLMQLIPPTAENVAREMALGTFEHRWLSSPSYNIRLGSYYLHKVLATFKGNVALAAAAYNAGPTSVTRWLETGEQLPLDVFVARIPFDETRAYAARVVGNVARYAYLAGGDEAIPALELEIPKGLRAPKDAY